LKDFPRISIITPSYNQAQFLSETIQSILDQKYPNLEYLVIDGGSTDGSVDIIRRYESSLSYWVSEPDRGQAHAINKGFEKATGDILMWLNSDDILFPGALALASEIFAAKPDLQWVVGNPVVIDTRSNIIDHRVHWLKPTFTMLFFTFYTLNQESVFFRKEALGTKRLRSDLHYCFDYELWLWLARKFGPPQVHPGFLAGYRYHQAQKTRQYEEYMLETERMKLDWLPNLDLTLQEYQRKRQIWNFLYKRWGWAKQKKEAARSLLKRAGKGNCCL
jgi:glycosyltransferase involved in cell wall biosynthesis